MLIAKQRVLSSIFWVFDIAWTGIEPQSFESLANRFNGMVDRVFANGLGDQGSIPGWVIPKIQKMVLDASLYTKSIK